MILDLFGEEIREPRASMVKGYAARPGSGPVGETCRSCARKVKVRSNVRGYWKCALLKPTAGPGTDIRLKSPACAYWIAEAEKS